MVNTILNNLFVFDSVGNFDNNNSNFGVQRWGLLELLKFYAASFMMMTAEISNTAHFMLERASIDEKRQRFAETLSQVKEAFAIMPMSQVLQVKLSRLEYWITYPSFDPQTVNVLLCELQSDCEVEINQWTMLMIPPHLARQYDQPTFGDAVAKEFPDAAYDISRTLKCHAVEEWDAAVFHAMRVLEKGLHRLAIDLKVTMSEEIELENWKSIIDQMESQIRTLEREPRSIAKSQLTTYYSQAAINFRYFKDAWRNHVSHSRSQYEATEATTVLQHVKNFMVMLAEKRPRA